MARSLQESAHNVRAPTFLNVLQMPPNNSPPLHLPLSTIMLNARGVKNIDVADQNLKEGDIVIPYVPVISNRDITPTRFPAL
jgi:hypothetical protein